MSGHAPRRRRARTYGVAAAVALLVAGVVVATILVRRASTGSASPTRPPPAPTASVVRANVADVTAVDGTLGYGGTYRVTARAAGTVTWLPAAGATVTRGQRLYAVDATPVSLFYGSIPFYRPLQVGVSDGPDVRVLEVNLVGLGYDDDLDVDDHFSSATAWAIRQWQDALGTTQSGRFTPGDAVVEPGSVRVSSVLGAIGDPAQGPLLQLSGTTRSVTVDLDVDQQDIARVGGPVSVKLPDGSHTPGTVTEIGTAVSAAAGTSGSGSGAGPASGGSSGSNSSPTVPVTIRLDRPRGAGRLDAAPVTVTFTTAVHRGVLAVPVQALLAVSGGGSAVEVVDADGAHRLLAVRLGLSTDSLVEISGAGLSVGMRVVTAQ